MAARVTLDALEFASVRATQRTQWDFAEVSDGDGCTATVETTCGGRTEQVIAHLSETLSSLKGKPLEDEGQIVGLLGLTPLQLQADFTLATAVSGLRTAVVQLRCRHEGVSMTETLGGTPQESVALYANVNRSIAGDWTTPNFAAAAELAVRDGFTAIKCAPFDDMDAPASEPDNLELALARVERVAAVRSAVGPEVRVLVDCHSRLNVHTAPRVAEEMAKLDVGWFEEPLQPTIDPAGLAQVTSEVGLPVAGGEAGYGIGFFSDLLERGAVEVVMPDIKHCGGVAEATKIGRAAVNAGGGMSLHSPSGPLSQLASAHVTAAVPGAMALEHAVNEVAWRAELLTPPERIEGGRIWMPGGTELGAALNADAVTKYGRRWRV